MSCSGEAFDVRVNLATSHCAALAAASCVELAAAGIVVRGASMRGLAEEAPGAARRWMP
jgi:RNA-splicing ligase RtcB